MVSDKLQSYFRAQQVSLQWLPVLRAMAAEMSEQMDAEDLRQLFFHVGERFAQDAGDCFQGAQSLIQLEDSLNDFWSQINWGWVSIKEVQEHIDISHQSAPLAEAFGDEALVWSIGLLEGFYQNVFRVLGASDSMMVCRAGKPTAGMDVHLRFGRQL